MPAPSEGPPHPNILAEPSAARASELSASPPSEIWRTPTVVPDTGTSMTTTVEGLEGRRLGPYALETRLGAGGMGVVYRARDTRLDRSVAIKVLPATIAADQAARERFALEARAVAALIHPHICHL